MSAAEPGLSAGKRKHVDRKQAWASTFNRSGASYLRHCSQKRKPEQREVNKQRKVQKTETETDTGTSRRAARGEFVVDLVSFSDEIGGGPPRSWVRGGGDVGRTPRP